MSTPTTPGPDDRPKQTPRPTPSEPPARTGGRPSTSPTNAPANSPASTPAAGSTPGTGSPAATSPGTSTTGASTPSGAGAPGTSTPAGSTPGINPSGTSNPAGSTAGLNPSGKSNPAGSSPGASAGSAGTAGGTVTDTPTHSSPGESKAAWWKGAWRGLKRVKWRRNPWVTVGGVVLALVVVAAVGYFAGLGPMSRLNTARDITPPAKLGGLDRVTDAQIREQLKLEETRAALSRINDGKQATVEAYGNLDGKRLYVVIALRGKVDIDKTIKDSGATPEQVKKVGQSTCVESAGNLPTQCYRGSNTLTVIAQAANDGVGVDDVGALADEAFNAMK